MNLPHKAECEGLEPPCEIYPASTAFQAGALPFCQHSEMSYWSPTNSSPCGGATAVRLRLAESKGFEPSCENSPAPTVFKAEAIPFCQLSTLGFFSLKNLQEKSHLSVFPTWCFKKGMLVCGIPCGEETPSTTL
jgi:hypothetical protein